MKIGDGISQWKELPYFSSNDGNGTALPSQFTWGDLSGVGAEDSPSTTTYLNLTKPAYSDKVDIAVFNNNANVIDYEIKETNDKLAVQTSRIDSFVSNYPIVEGDVSAEVEDARIGYDNNTYESAGEAIRAIGYALNEFKNDMANFIDADAIDGLLYEDSKLYLTANGVIVSEPVEIVGGTGSGGSGGTGATYSISLTNLLGSRIISVAKGDNVALKFNYSSVDIENFGDGPGIGYITVNNIRKASLSVAQGENTIDVTNYLADGENTVQIKVENSEGNSRLLAYTVNVIALSVSTTFSTMDLYTGAVGFPYTVTGQGEKTVHFILDNRELGTVSITSSNRSQVYSIANQNDGAHILKVYAEVDSEGVLVKSNTLVIGMLWYSSTTTEPAVLINFDTTFASQGETLTIPYMAYNPFSEETEVSLTILNEDGSVYSEKQITVDQSAKTWVTQDYPAGNTVFQITCGTASASVTVNVSPSNFTLTLVEDKILEFNAAGRSNQEANPAQWSYNDIIATFDGFGWAGADGWVEDEDGQTVLRFLPGNSMFIPFKPFEADMRDKGYTIEVELATHNVRDYETVVISSFTEERGFVIQSQQAYLASEQIAPSALSVQFKEDEKVRITFVVEAANLNRFIYIYINGVMCGVKQYAEADDFQQTNAVGITIGAESSGLDLYTLRFYNKNLSRTEQLDNFICDRPTLAERIEAEKRNNILNEAEEVTIANLPMTIPYMILECEELPQFKGDKKKNKSVVYVDQMNPSRSFTAEGVELNVQGTSSAGYPVKNYKVKLGSGLTYTASGETAKGFPIFEEGLPGKTICLKADFASSENANNVMLIDYYEENVPYKTPPQEENEFVRQGVRGFPIVVFWRNTETDEVKFIGKYNANDDKSNENVFGFDRDIYPNLECWEFCNNTSDRVIFKSADFTSQVVGEDGSSYPAWKDDFEPRFPDLDEMYDDITQLKRVCEWLVSTDRSAATNADLPEEQWLEDYELINETMDELGVSTKAPVVHTTDSERYRLVKFRKEFNDYLIKDPIIFYYIFTEVFLMVDSRAKNMFLTTFDGIHWFPLPYDFDTGLGINNEGQLVFDYNLEDTDTVGEADVFNGQHSVLWCNVRDAFQSEIKSMYQTLRSSNNFSYETITEKMYNHQSTWPEALWNEDAYVKYLEPYLTLKQNYLDMLQGDKRAQRDWWLFNDFRYRDSKYFTGDATSKMITLRCYEVGNIELTPYSHIWPTVKFGSATVSMRGERNNTYTMVCPLDNMNDTEVYIYSADRIADIGDLSHLKVGLAIFSDATKLQTIKLGSSAEGYVNTNLKSLTVGNNELLTLLNIENCSSLTDPIDLSGCHGLETLQAIGSSLTGVNLPNGGHLKTLELPASLTNFTIQNQKGIESLIFAGYDKLSTIRIENTPNIPIETIINSTSVLNRVRLTNVSWTATNEESLRTTFNILKGCRGMDALGSNVDKAVVTGRVYIDSIDESFLEELNDEFPELIVVVAGVAKFFIRYVNYDNSLLYKYIINEGDDAINPVEKGIITEPVRGDTDDAQYEYQGWSEMPTSVTKAYTIIARYSGVYLVNFYDNEENIINSQWINEGEAAYDPVETGEVSAPKKESTQQYNYSFSKWSDTFYEVKKPLKLYPMFNETLRDYPVYFMNDGIILQEGRVYYGSRAQYLGEASEIVKYIAGEPSSLYDFTGWSPNPDETIITGTTYFYAQFAFDGYITDSWETIAENAKKGNVDAYAIGSRKTLEIEVDGTYSLMEMELVGKNHDNLSAAIAGYNGNKTTAAFSFYSKNLMNLQTVINASTKSYNGYETLNAGGWEKCEAKQWVTDSLIPALPEELQNVIRSVNKYSDRGYYTQELALLSEKVWLASATELNLDSASLVVTGQGQPYSLFTSGESREKISPNERIKLYWTRSSKITGQHYWFHVGASGVSDARIGANSNLGIAFGFCI